MQRAAVDLTPLLPGGTNGGSRVMTLALLEALEREAPDWEWIRVHKDRDGEGERERAANETPAPAARPPSAARRLVKGAVGLLPVQVARTITRGVRRLSREATAPFQRSRAARPDLVFSPFGSTTLLGADVPFVTVVYDLQYETFPHFFRRTLVEQRRIETAEIAADAAGVACISDYVRKTFLAATGADPSKVFTIPISLPARLSPPTPAESEAALSRYGLDREGFLIYPANFWPHKNHPLLLRAFASLPAAIGGRLKLVLAGEDTGGAADVEWLARSLGLEGRVLRTGYLPDCDLAALLYAARALVYPSLYEGFGMPVVEALAAGVPVACSATTSLPEVAGEAAITFDPASEDEVARALTEVADLSSERRETMRAEGLRRVERLGGPEKMARRYLDLFELALERRPG